MQGMVDGMLASPRTSGLLLRSPPRQEQLRNGDRRILLKMMYINVINHKRLQG